MNDSYSHHDLVYRPRRLAPAMRKAVEEHPVVILTGARQVGKSTLLRHEEPFGGWRYVTLDDFGALGQAEREPSVLWAGADRVVLDEVQKSPALLSAVKQAVDRRRRAVRFVLSGSANLLLMQSISETLAGRAVYFTLFPMTLGELRGEIGTDLLRAALRGVFRPERTVEPVESPLPHMLRGFMPPLATLSSSEAVLRWWEGYVATYLERDLRSLSQIESLADFRRVMEALALRSGQMLNQTEVSRDTGVSQPTVHRYLNLLEASHLAVRLPAFSRSRTKRLIKTPKLYWADSGLASYLGGHHDAESLAASREAGGVFETLVLLHIQVVTQLWVPRPRLFYWRTTTGKEVDFVIEQGRRLLAVEVKLSSAPHYADAEGLRLFCEDNPEAVGGLLIHAGSEVKQLDERIVAVPWQLLG